MVRQAAGAFIPPAGCLRMNRHVICARLVIRKEMEMRMIKGAVDESGNIQSTAIHSLTSPAPIQPLDQAETNMKQKTHISK